MNAWDTKVSMLFNLLLARTRTLSFFFCIFLVLLSNVLLSNLFQINRKIKVKLALAIPTGASIKVVKEIILHHLCRENYWNFIYVSKFTKNFT